MIGLRPQLHANAVWELWWSGFEGRKVLVEGSVVRMWEALLVLNLLPPCGLVGARCLSLRCSTARCAAVLLLLCVVGQSQSQHPSGAFILHENLWAVHRNMAHAKRMLLESVGFERSEQLVFYKLYHSLVRGVFELSFNLRFVLQLVNDELVKQICSLSLLLHRTKWFPQVVGGGGGGGGGGRLRTPHKAWGDNEPPLLPLFVNFAYSIFSIVLCTGEVAGALGCGLVRVLGRGVSGGAWEHSRGTQGHCQCHRNDQDDSSHQRSVT